MIEQTLVLVKPDGVARGLIGEVIKRFEQRGLKIVALKLIQIDENTARNHYTAEITQRHGEHVRNSLVEYVTRSPVVAMIIEGVGAIAIVRKIVGSTFPGEAELGTIRGDFCHVSKEYAKAKNHGYNVVHASANLEDARREIPIWFSVDEVYSYKRLDDEAVL